MPTNKPGYWSKNWWANYKKYQWTKKAKKERASRNGARRSAVKSWKAKKGDWKDVHHKNGNPRDNKKSNLAVVTKKYNRRDWAKKATASKKRKKKTTKKK